MWISTDWKDYELLDCGGGERLERWGKYLLVRPDPQAIWRPEGRHPGWRRHDARYQRASTGGGQWVKKELPQRWTLGYKGLTLNIKPMNFKHTGVFPEQAANWDFAMERIRSAGRPIQVLNLFAYTGAASVACAAAGAAVCQGLPYPGMYGIDGMSLPVKAVFPHAHRNQIESGSDKTDKLPDAVPFRSP